jgi:hypothetical protein
LRNLTSRIVLALLLLTVSSAVVAADAMQDSADRTLIRELMDRYGLVHDSGTPEEYADLFTADGEIAVAPGGPAVVKGRQALLAQARRDHERFGTEPAANGTTTSIMRHLISNAQITITGADTATGMLDVARLGALLERVRGGLKVVNLEKVSPFAVPILLTIGRESVPGVSQEWVLEEAEIEAELIAEALS